MMSRTLMIRRTLAGHGCSVCSEVWGVAAGRTLKSFPSIRTDLRNADADVVDQDVVVDKNLITSRS